MIKGWALRNPNQRVGFIAVSAAPLLAVSMVAIATTDLETLSISSATCVALVLAVFLVCFKWMGVGRLLLGRDSLLFLARTAQAIAIGIGLAWVIVRLLPEVSLGYTSSAVVGVASAVMLVGVRSVLPLLKPARAISDNILVLGREDLARTLCTALQSSAPLQRTVSGGANGRGNLDLDAEGLKTLVRAEGISRIVVVGPEAETSRPISDALLECRLLGVQVEDGIELYQRLHGKLWLDALEPGRLAFSDGFRLTPSYRVLKRAIDVVGAITVLVVAAPLIALIALAVRLESAGPILFRQVRVGQFGRTFTLFKFRSMREDAEKDGPTWATEDDQRVTRIGRFLRRSHLDELPQAWNVLRGDLSFVGPRPERPCFVEMLRQKIDYFDLRLYVKPGITGWAQVCYPYCGSVEDSFEKVQYDLYYARHASLELDLRIVLRTGIVMLAGRGR